MPTALTSFASNLCCDKSELWKLHTLPTGQTRIFLWRQHPVSSGLNMYGQEKSIHPGHSGTQIVGSFILSHVSMIVDPEKDNMENHTE